MKAIVICRDRVVYADQCVRALMSSPGIDDIHIVDHGSTYPDMQTWLGFQAGQNTLTRHDTNGRLIVEKDFRVHVRWRANAHPRDLWTNGTLADIVQPDERFILTDCDVEPPSDPGWVEHLGALLDLVPEAVKAGCGLRTDDLPDHYVHADRAREWEAQYQGFNTLVRDRATGLAYYLASVDTTLAMYRGLAPMFQLDPAVRTADARFMARHLPWYEDSAKPTGEQRWYREHATPGLSQWLDPDRYIGTHGLGGQ